MKLIQMTLTAMALFVLLLSTACASHRQTNGLLIGGGTGAIVGQAIGHNAESTIVGATVGGVLGLIIGSELDRNHHRGGRSPNIVTHFGGEHHDRYNNRRYNNRNYDRRPIYRDNRSHNNNRHNQGNKYHGKQCREVTTIHHGRHGSRRIVSSSCGNNPKVWKKNGKRRY